MKQVVEETVLGIPHLVVICSDAVHRIGDPKELFEETKGDLFIHGVVLAENERDLQHVLAVESHPRRAIRLVDMAASGKFGAAVENANIVEAQEAASKNVAPLRIFSIDPPIEIQHQTLKGALQK